MPASVGAAVDIKTWWVVCGWLAIGCAAEDHADLDGGNESSGGDEAGSTDSGGPGDGNTESTDPDDDSTSGAASSSDTGGSSTGEPPDPDTGDSTGGEPTGVCIFNISQIDLDGVFARDGGAIDDSCEPAAVVCGGDIVGTWEGAAGCGEPFPDPVFACDGLEWVGSFYTPQGTRTFAQDGTYDFDAALRLGAFVSAPPDCLGAGSCDVLASSFGRGSSWVEVDGACECDLFVIDLPQVSTGTYEVQDDAIELDGEGDPIPFCVAGDRLDLFQTLQSFTQTMDACSDDQTCIDLHGEGAQCMR